MSDGTSSSLPKEKAQKNQETQTSTKVVDDAKETTHAFQNRISDILMDGGKWVETTKEMMEYITKPMGGLHGAKYFTYGKEPFQVFVCEFGQTETLQAEMGMSAEDKAFGQSAEGKLVT